MEEDIKTLKSLKKGLMAFVEGAVEQSLSNTMKQVLEVRRKQVQAIENLINKNKELEKDVKQHKKYIKRMVRLEQLNYKIIKLMAKDIAENKLDEDICRKVKNPAKEDCYGDDYDMCKDCVIEFYKKKASVENG